jgi:sugar phosphate permease
VETFGWDAGFLMFVVASAIGSLLFAIGWRARADGYRQRC